MEDVNAKIHGNRVYALFKDLEEVGFVDSRFDASYFENVKNFYEENGFITGAQFNSLHKSCKYFMYLAEKDAERFTYD